MGRDELKKCKCGLVAVSIEKVSRGMYVAWCPCGRRGPFAETEESAIALLNADRLAEEKAREALNQLVGTIEAHDVMTLDCDRRGDEVCNCLDQPMKRAREALSLLEAR